MAVTVVKLPDVGEESAELIAWLVSLGQVVSEDEPLVLIRLSAAEGEITSPASGVIVSLGPEPGERLRIGEVLAEIEDGAAAGAGDELDDEPARGQEAETTTDAHPFKPPNPFAPFNPSIIEAKLAGIAQDGELGAAERIERLRRLFERDLTDEWERLVRSADAYADGVAMEEGSQLTSANSAHAERLRLVKEDHAAATGRAQAQLAKLKKELDNRRQEGTELVQLAWNKVGAGLALREPQEALAAVRAESGISASGSGELTYMRGMLKELPHVPKASEDPAYVKYWWWGGGSALLLFWFLSQTFFVGVGVGALVALLIIFIRSTARNRYRDIYERLVKVVATDQAISTRELEEQARQLEAKVAAANSEASTQRQGSDRLLEEASAEVAARAQAALTAGAHVYKTSRAACGKLTAAIETAINEVVAAAPDLYGPWSAAGDPPPPSLALSLRERTRFRLGEADRRTLRASKIAPGAAPVLGQAGPTFWNLGDGRSLLFTDTGPSGEGRGSFATPVLSRILHQLPPGKAHLTLFDPLGLGRNFGAFVKLGDYSDLLINGKVWSNVEHIRAKLKDLIGHIETVTQKYLRNDYPDLETYNIDAGEIAEPYRFLVLADFPECFDEDILRDLLRILQNGPRCGVFVIMHANIAAPTPRGVDLSALKPFFVELARIDASRRHEFNGATRKSTSMVEVDEAPLASQTSEIVRRYGEGAKGSLRVEVPYQRLIELAGHGSGLWEQSSAKGISVPLGPVGVKKVQSLNFGAGLCHHGLLIGRPGSGKSNLMHVFITTAARLYAPDELQLYLVDFKQGVEFKRYADSALPHARVIAVQSEREFGLSVLQGLEAEMSRRGDLFRAAGANSIADYREKTGTKLPRIVLLVDEFQEFFVRDDKIKREAALLIGRLVSQARYSGIHLLLGSQSLATAALERPVRDQMTVRIALQCSEADSRLILAEDNTAARLLSRPGEAIYNDDAGSLEGNNLFQVAMFSEEDQRRELKQIGDIAKKRAWLGDPPVVFEGHEPGDLANCRPIAGAAPPLEPPSQLCLWLGEPTSLKPMVAVPIKRHAGRNMLVLTRDEEQGVGVIMASLLSLAVQIPARQASFRIVDLTSADAPWADHPEIFAECMPHDVEVVGRHQLKALLAELAGEVKRRTGEALMKEPSVFFVVLGLQRARELRNEGASSFSFSMSEEAGPDARAQLDAILRDGPEVGVHGLLWCDAYANLERTLERGVSEMGLKVSGPLSDQESRRLFDEDAAATLDKPHRMLVADDERVGVLEVFRPYRLPVAELIHQVGAGLRSKVRAKGPASAPEPVE